MLLLIPLCLVTFSLRIPEPLHVCPRDFVAHDHPKENPYSWVPLFPAAHYCCPHPPAKIPFVPQALTCQPEEIFAQDEEIQSLEYGPVTSGGTKCGTKATAGRISRLLAALTDN